MAGGLDAPIDPKLIDTLIRLKGVNLYLYQVRRCPCLDAQGYVDPECPVCDGMAYTPGEPRPIRALFSAYQAGKKLIPGGQIETGTRQLVPPRHIRLSDGDWVRMRQFPVRESEVVSGPEVKLSALFPKDVLSVVTIRDGALFEVPKASYTDAATGQTVRPDGSLCWRLGAPVSPLEQLTVEYRHFEAYQVYRGEMPMQRGAEDKRLPDRALCRLITKKNLVRPATGDDHG